MVVFGAGNAFGEAGGSFYTKEDPRDGFYYYVDPAVEAEREESGESQPLPPVPVMGPMPSEAQMMAMHPVQLSQIFDERLNYAMYVPSEENVTNYLKVKDVTRRKAVAVAAAEQVVLMQSPKYNINKDYPISGPGRKVRNLKRQDDIRGALGDGATEFALLYFVKDDCEYCEAQSPILKRFRDRYGWDIRTIDVGRRPDLEIRYGIEYTPTVLLIYKHSRDYMTILVGIEDLPNIEANVYRAMRLMKGETTPSQFFTLRSQDGGSMDPLSTVGQRGQSD